MNMIIKFFKNLFSSAQEAGVKADRVDRDEACYKPGETYRATVSTVRASGVSVRMPDGRENGMVSAKCWGKGAARLRALAKLNVGDVLDVIVKSYNPNGGSVSLLLKGFATQKGTAAKPTKRPVQKKSAKSHASSGKKGPHAGPQAKPCKPAYTPLAAGTTFLFDTANLIGKIGPEHAARRLETLSATLKARGYKALFFWEHRSYVWTRANQASAEDTAALVAFSRRKDVSLVGEESDLALLQTAREIPDSVIVTQDRLDDYAQIYPELVTPARHRSFSTVIAKDRLLLTIYGLKDAIALDEPPKPEVAFVPAPVDEWKLEVDADVLQRRAAPPPVIPCRHGLLGAADGCLLHGDVRRGLALLGRAARKNPKVYRDMAEIFRSAEASSDAARKADRYDRLADRREKAQRESRRRKRRQHAEHLRGVVLWLDAA